MNLNRHDSARYMEKVYQQLDLKRLNERGPLLREVAEHDQFRKLFCNRCGYLSEWQVVTDQELIDGINCPRCTNIRVV